jgi:predicted TIM-barrel fold metal-dependent hydrolase
VLRREFLTGLAALGAGRLFAAPDSKAKAGRIDVHHHFFPPDYVAAITALGAAASPAWSTARSLEEMDRSGIATSVMSLSPPSVWTGDVAKSRTIARNANEYGARMAADHPGRFRLFAALPLPDSEGSLREMEHALDTLHASGIGLMTSYGNHWLGDPEFQPVWAELNRRKAVVYTHPITPACCGNLDDAVPAVAIEWATDTTRTIASLVFSGVAARYPDIRWIFSHGGGTMPFLLSRFLYQEKTMKDRAARLPNGLMFELQKFYYDTAQANHPGALAALLKVVTPQQLLFGTDFPYRDGAEVIAGLNAHAFSDKELADIERNNAMRFIPGIGA